MLTLLLCELICFASHLPVLTVMPVPVRSVLVLMASTARTKSAPLSSTKKWRISSKTALGEPLLSLVTLPVKSSPYVMMNAHCLRVSFRRMLSPAITRMNGAYSPILGVASTSQANIVNGPRTSHTQRSQPESRHSSQSSRQSSYKHHQPSLVPHLEGPPSEDAGSTFDALNTSYSLASYGGNRTRQEHANYGTMVLGGLGASATQRRFQVHRGRPPSRKKNDEYEPVSDPAGQKIQPNGLLPSAGHAHEVHCPTSPNAYL